MLRRLRNCSILVESALNTGWVRRMREYASDPDGQSINVPGNRDRQRPGPDRSSTEILLDITDLLAGAPTLSDLFKRLVPPLRELAKCDVVSFALYDASQHGIVTDFWQASQEAGLGRTFPVHESPCGWVWQHQEPLTIPDLELETRFSGVVQELLGLGVRQYTLFPLSTPKRHYGAVGIGMAKPKTGFPAFRSSLERAMRLIGLAVENHELNAQWQKEQGRLERLAALTRRLSTLDPQQLIPVICDSLRQITQYDYARVALLEPGARWLQLRSCEPEAAGQAPREFRIPLADAISARAIETRTVTFHTVAELTNYSERLVSEIRDSGARSLCSVPLMLGSRVLGAMIVGTMRGSGMTSEDGEYLLQVGTQIAAAIHNATAHPDSRAPAQAPEKRPTGTARSQGNMDDIIGTSPALQGALDYAAVVAKTDATVLITGETGTGKERIARAIHRISQRKEFPFIKLNCAAIPTGLLESELFGHEKGAFTGAVSQKVGRLELADKGTLLLDEVGEISLELQPKLLRVLQDQEFERLGGTKTIRVDVRLIAASNRDLERAVEAKLFRSDLFYRLHVFPIHMPPLRERRQDIPLLIRHFVQVCAARQNKQIDFIPDAAVEEMMNWDWPGNIRELENFIERSVILSDGNRLNPPLAEMRGAFRRSQDSERTLRDRERDHIVEVLRQTGGVLSGPTGAAARLGLKRTTLQYKMQRLGISRSDYLS